MTCPDCEGDGKVVYLGKDIIGNNINPDSPCDMHRAYEVHTIEECVRCEGHGWFAVVDGIEQPHECALV